MLAVDELDLEGGEERLGDGGIRHDPVRLMERPSPGSVTDVHAGRRGELAAAVGEDGQHLGHHPLAGVSSGRRWSWWLPGG
jgi:hypothetical protein